MKLRKKQREYLLQLIAEGLALSEINEHAAQFRPRFKVNSQMVDYYRKSRGLALEEIQENSEADALKTGLALKEERVKALKLLAQTLLAELTREKNPLLWTENAKAIGTERYDYLEFNKAEIDALRGVLDDIAAEVGDRLKKVDVTSAGEKLAGLPPEQIAQRVAALMELAQQRKETNGN